MEYVGSPEAEIIAELDDALAALEHVRSGIAGARIAVAKDGADLAEIWRTLAELGYPMTHVGAHAIGAMRVIGEQLRMAPTAPDQLAWLTGVDLRAAYGMQQRELSDRAERLLAWLAPYLSNVSPRTRTAVRAAIEGAAEGRSPCELLDQLTSDTFVEELASLDGGLVGMIRGIGPRGLRELRVAIGVVEKET
jgi:hypothetical protein